MRPLSATNLTIARFFTLFKIGGKLLRLLGLGDFLEDSSLTAEYADEGKALIRRERLKRQRNDQQVRWLLWFTISP